MIKGKIHSVESMGLVDGPGIRVVVFMQGCTLRCLYCHNPDTWTLDGNKDALDFTPEELVNKISRFRSYFEKSGGGVTFSGGDPLKQPEFLKETLKLCKEAGIPYYFRYFRSRIWRLWRNIKIYWFSFYMMWSI